MQTMMYIVWFLAAIISENDGGTPNLAWPFENSKPNWRLLETRRHDGLLLPIKHKARMKTFWYKYSFELQPKNAAPPKKEQITLYKGWKSCVPQRCVLWRAVHLILTYRRESKGASCYCHPSNHGNKYAKKN